MADTGTIITRSYTSDAQIPVSDAGILFFRRDDSGVRTLLAVRISDVSGKTTPVTISTPAAAESQSPTEASAWTSLDLIAVHSQYGCILVDNVQVFPGTVTVQDLQFVPTEAGFDVPETPARFDTTPQPLR